MLQNSNFKPEVRKEFLFNVSDANELKNAIETAWKFTIEHKVYSISLPKQISGETNRESYGTIKHDSNIKLSFLYESN